MHEPRMRLVIQAPTAPVRHSDGLHRGNRADAKIDHLEVNGAVIASTPREDVRRLQIAVHHPWVEPVGVPDDLGKLLDDLCRLNDRGFLGLPMPLLYQTCEIASFDVLSTAGKAGRH